MCGDVQINCAQRRKMRFYEYMSTPFHSVQGRSARNSNHAVVEFSR